MPRGRGRRSRRARRCSPIADATPIARLAAILGLAPGSRGRRPTPRARRAPAARRGAHRGGARRASATSPTARSIGMFIGGLFEGRLPEIDPIFVAFDEEALRRVDDPYPGHLGVPARSFDAGPGSARRRPSDCFARRPPCSVGATPAASSPGASPRSPKRSGATGDARGAQAAVDEFDRVHPRRHAQHRRRDRARSGMGCRRRGVSVPEPRTSRWRPLKLLIDRSDAAVGVLALHDAVRLGASPRLVEHALDEPMRQAEGPVVAAMTRHVQSLASADLDALRPCRRRVRLGLDAAARRRGVCSGVIASPRRRGLRARQREASTRAAAAAGGVRSRADPHARDCSWGARRWPR